MKRCTVKLIVSSGQYETAARVVRVRYTTVRGLARRIRQLAWQDAIYGDNWAGWIKARVAIASKGDRWGRNSIIGGSWCEPENGWLDLGDRLEQDLVYDIQGEIV